MQNAGSGHTLEAVNSVVVVAFGIWVHQPRRHHFPWILHVSLMTKVQRKHRTGILRPFPRILHVLLTILRYKGNNIPVYYITFPGYYTFHSLLRYKGNNIPVNNIDTFSGYYTFCIKVHKQ